jgi:uncharacterized protein (TIGR03435 family)
MRLALAALGLAGGLWAQNPPSFEVASVKPNISGDRFPNIGPTAGGKLLVTNATVFFLIHTAYRLDDFRIAGAPGWTNSDKFDIAAKAANPNATPDEIRLMLQTLLADRFQLTAHREQREQPRYALVAAKGRPKLQKAKSETCTESTAQNPCGGFRIYRRSQMWGNTVTVGQFASELTFMMQRMVVDKTGLEGLYDIRVEWTPEQFGPEPGTEMKPDEAFATLFTSLQEQLGLRLQPEKGPVEVLVIDKVARPVAN